MNNFTETLRSWQNFYFMTGGAAAALLGLMFVAVSMGVQHLGSAEITEDMRAFVTPNILYFTSALLLACAMLIPTITPLLLAILLLVGGLFGLVRTVPSVLRLISVARRNQDFNRADWLAQIILPVTSYVLILIATLGFLLNRWSLAFMTAWLAMILLLIAAIANTWSLVIWVVEQRSE